MIQLTSVSGIDCCNESGGDSDDSGWIVTILLRSIFQKSPFIDVVVQEHTYHGSTLKGRGNRRMERGKLSDGKERKAK